MQEHSGGIPETRYNRHIPADELPPNPAREIVLQTLELWRRRPSTEGLYVLGAHCLGWLGCASATLGVGVGVVDTTFGLHLGHDMAEVRVEPRSNALFRGLESGVHDIGAEIVQAEDQSNK